MLQLISESKSFGGLQKIYSHESDVTNSLMRFGIYLPPQVVSGNKKVPVLYWLSGLTCTEENFISKAGAQRIAAETGLILVAPDTSPRNLSIPGDKDSYDFGEGAGFYLDATEEPWAANYQMYSYVSRELFDLVAKNFPVAELSAGIFGHSMGGHGALTLALKNPKQYKTVSAFAPICAPMKSHWGQKAFHGYLGDDKKKWEEYDTCQLIEKLGWIGPSILVDQGTADKFLKEQELQPELLQEACQKARVKLDLRMQEGYDHSYYFISTFMEEHIRYHASFLSP
jgi:S-formylglutathione hydrolase